MARQQATLSTLPTALIEALNAILAIKPADDSQRIAQSEMVKALQTALDARRQRIVDQQICRWHSKMGGDPTSGTLHVDRHRHGPQRQPAYLRYSADPLCNRHGAVAPTDRRLQSSIYGRDFCRTRSSQASHHQQVGQPAVDQFTCSNRRRKLRVREQRSSKSKSRGARQTG